MLVRNKLEHKTCSDGMLLPERISPIVMRPVGRDALLLCNLPTSTVRISFAHVLRFFPYPPNNPQAQLKTASPPRTPTLELLSIVDDDLDAKHALAFGINLQSQLAAVQFEDRQIIRSFLDRYFPSG